MSCPSAVFIDSLVSNPQWQRLHEKGEKVTCIAHLGPRVVVDTEKYRAFMISFGPGCQVCKLVSSHEIIFKKFVIAYFSWKRIK